MTPRVFYNLDLHPQDNVQARHFLGHCDQGGNQVTHSPQLPHHAGSCRLGGSTGKKDKEEMTGVGCFGGWLPEHKCVGPDALCQAAVENSDRERGEAGGRDDLREKGGKSAN